MEVTCAIIVLIMLGVISGVISLYFNYKKKNVDKISFKEAIDLTGLPIITLKIEGNKMNFILDTGSTTTVVDSNVLQKYNIKYDITHETYLMGVEGTLTPVIKGILTANYKNKSYAFPATIKDMSKAFTTFKETKGVTLAGLLGSDFFEKFKYVIDFNKLVVYSK